MGTVSLGRSLAVADLLKTRRKKLGFTLNDVARRLHEKGERLPPSTLARIESGRLDPGVRRLHLLLDLYGIPGHVVTDLVEMEALAADSPRGDNLEALYQDGRAAWIKGNVPKGLAYLFAVRRFVPADDASRLLRQKACLAFASLARDLGKVRVARQTIDDLLCEPPDPSLLSRTLVLASSLWRMAGSLDMAMALVNHAELVLTEEETDRALVLHQKAKLSCETNELEEAESALLRAISIFHDCGDIYSETRARTLHASILEKGGRYAGALECARRIIEIANGKHGRLEMMGRLELGRLLVVTGSIEQGLSEFRQALAQAVVLEDRQAQFLSHYRLWKTYERLGDHDRAALERNAAGYFVRFTDEESPETTEMRKLAHKGEMPWDATLASQAWQS